MSFIWKLFTKKKSNVNKAEVLAKNEYVIKLSELQSFMMQLLSADKYIAKSEYCDKSDTYRQVVEYFNVLKDSGMLDVFCSKNGVQALEVQECLVTYLNLEKCVDQHNEDYINRTMSAEKEYLDNILKSVDTHILLDDDQRRVILTDEDL